jgi:hypothetical protein
MNAEQKERFEAWWADVGSGLAPLPGEDREEHARRVAEVAWGDALVVADLVNADRVERARRGEAQATRLLASFVRAHEDGELVPLDDYDEAVVFLPASPGARPRLSLVPGRDG